MFYIKISIESTCRFFVLREYRAAAAAAAALRVRTFPRRTALQYAFFLTVVRTAQSELTPFSECSLFFC